MNFLATLSQQQYVISANTWSECLAYCEGTGLDITSIQSIPQAITHYNVAGTNSYQVTALDSEGSQINNIVWETDFNSLSTWLDSQGYESIRTIQQANKTYVVV